MAGYELITVKNKKKWEDFVLSRKPHTFLQSWNWGEVKKSMGNKIYRLGILQNKKLKAACLIIVEKAKRGSYFLIPAGPIMDWDDEGMALFFLEQIKRLARKEHVWFIRLRPEILNTSMWLKKFSNWGFVPSPMHVHAENTWILDISKTEEELLAGMRKSTRYLVRKSQKSGLKVDISKDSKKAKLIYDLQEETAKRHNFIGFSEKLFQNEIKYFAKENLASVFTCRLKNKPLAAAIIVYYGDSAYYHYSGSVSGYGKIPFSYFLQWKIIQEAKKKKFKYYNFWGIAPNDNPNHRFAGVTLFKTGFGGERIDWLHSQDLPLSPFYWFTYLFESFRRLYRRL